jgi:hypothetical protein
MECEILKGCRFYNDKMPMDRGLGLIQKKRFCEGDKSICARYKVATMIGRSNVPTDLYPIMMDRADNLISEYYRKLKKMP